MTSVLGVVSGLVRLPLRVAGAALGIARSVVPGGRREQPASSTRSAFAAGPVAEPDAGPRTPQGDPLHGPATVSSTRTDDDTGVGEPLGSVTDIDADAGPEDVDVTPSDVADAMGSQLDDRPPSPS